MHLADYYLRGASAIHEPVHRLSSMSYFVKEGRERLLRRVISGLPVML
jgi:hypothetical protein